MYEEHFSSNKQTPFCFNPDGCLHEMKENVAKISFFKHLFRRSEHFRYSMYFNQGRFCEKYKTFNDFHDWSLLIQPKSVSINNIPKKTIDIALICIFKCEFCKKLLLYECNSDQLPTFFILLSLLGGCNSQATANAPKSDDRMWATGQSCILKEVTSYKIHTLDYQAERFYFVIAISVLESILSIIKEVKVSFVTSVLQNCDFISQMEPAVFTPITATASISTSPFLGRAATWKAALAGRLSLNVRIF